VVLYRTILLYKVDVVDWSAERRLQWDSASWRPWTERKRGKRLKSCPRKASARSRNQRHIYVAVIKESDVFYPISYLLKEAIPSPAFRYMDAFFLISQKLT